MTNAVKSQNLQDNYLNQLRKDKIPVLVYLTNGVRLKGVIKGFDNFVIVLKENTYSLIYKHAVATIVPEKDVEIRLETAAFREAKEETGLNIKLIRQFHTYSDPKRDSRHHTITTVYIAKAKGIAIAGDDAEQIGAFKRGVFPEEIAFDHREILNDYFTGRY